VHRDVSPSNVLVSFDGAVKVSDFGIAKWAFQRTRTQEGTLKGKFAYMSPEQCRARPVDRRSDIFALGAILYELTTGSAPFAGASELDILNQIATGRAAAPAWPDAMGAYPPALSEIVLRALAPEVDERFQTMQELQIALESFARSSDVALSTVALASYLQQLFAEELAAWRAAQREGKSLADHLAAKPVAAASGDPAERTATDAFGTTAQHARKRARLARYGAIAAFFGVCAVAGAMATKYLRGTDAAAERGAPLAAPATESIAEKKPAAAIIPAVPAVATNPGTTETTGAKTKARVKTAAIRQGRTATAGPTAGPRPTAESRLGAWDPDSPVPP